MPTHSTPPQQTVGQTHGTPQTLQTMGGTGSSQPQETASLTTHSTPPEGTVHQTHGTSETLKTMGGSSQPPETNPLEQTVLQTHGKSHTLLQTMGGSSQQQQETVSPSLSTHSTPPQHGTSQTGRTIHSTPPQSPNNSTTAPSSGTSIAGSRGTDMEMPRSENIDEGSVHVHVITREQKLTLKLIERKRTELQDHEYKLEKQGNEVIVLLTSMLSLYMLVFGGGIVINNGPLIAYITSKGDEKTLIMMIALTVCTFVLGMGMAIFLAFLKLSRLKWKHGVIREERESLMRQSKTFREEISNNFVRIGAGGGGARGSANSSYMTLGNANNQIAACITSLGPDYFYHGHVVFVIANGVTATVFLGIIILLLIFSYNEHKHSGLTVKLGQPL